MSTSPDWLLSSGVGVHLEHLPITWSAESLAARPGGHAAGAGRLGSGVAGYVESPSPEGCAFAGKPLVHLGGHLVLERLANAKRKKENGTPRQKRKKERKQTTQERQTQA